MMVTITKKGTQIAELMMMKCTVHPKVLKMTSPAVTVYSSGARIADQSTVTNAKIAIAMTAKLPTLTRSSE